MKILLTGGAGFIGSHTCVELIEAGYDVVIADDLSNSKPLVLERLKELTGKEIKFYQLDIADSEKMDDMFAKEKFDAVIVANGTNFADALAGSYLSSKENAPILMTDKKDANIQKLVDYIKTNLKADGIVFILGGTSAVSAKTTSSSKFCIILSISPK